MLTTLVLMAVLTTQSPNDYNFFLSKNLARSAKYEESLILLAKVDKRKIDLREYTFYKALCHYKLNQKEPVAVELKRLTEDFFEIPERYFHLSTMMNEEVKQWKNGDLGMISRKMQLVTDRLVTSKTDKKTQSVQKEIVDDLTKLIEQKEHDAKNQEEKAAKAERDRDEKGRKNGTLPFKKLETNQIIDPLKDSDIMKNTGKGKVDEKRLKNLGAAWGKLPPKDRADAMQNMIMGLPVQYREVAERYFREISRAQEKK